MQNLDLESIIEQNLIETSVSSQISMQSLKSVFQNLIETYNEGLGLSDIRNLMFLITFIRFLFLLTKHNLKTSFYITSISFCAGLVWYFHTNEINVWYEDMLAENRLTKLVARNIFDSEPTSYGEEETFESEDSLIETLNSQDGTDSDFYDFLDDDPLQFIAASFLNATQKNGYRIDPFSMLMASMPESIKPQINRFYYMLFENVIPGIWNFINTQFTEIWSLILYLVIVRLGKKYCPYLIRWHWTFILVNSFIEVEFVKIAFRLWTYEHFELLPRHDYNEAAKVQFLYLSIISIHYLLHFFGLFHALCGQYFYVPFIVENTEIHIGQRPSNSIYSGGFTSWQNSEYQWLKPGNKKFVFPRFWWGWLGKPRPNDKKNKKPTIFKKLLRKLKKWILKN